MLLHVPEPGIPWDAPSSMVSPWWVWFRELGYPQLDIVRAEDGEWWIHEYLNSPIIPSLTKTMVVLRGMRNIEISFGFVEKFVKQIDLQLKAIWDREEAKTAEVEREHAATQRHRNDSVERAARAITRNEGLMNRIAKGGLPEMDLTRIRRNIPSYRLGKGE